MNITIPDLSFSFHGIADRIWNYSRWIDLALIISTSAVNITYLVVTVTVEYCAGPGQEGSLVSCKSILESTGVFSLYHSSMSNQMKCANPISLDSIILSLYAFILDFFFGSLLIYAILNVPTFTKRLDEIKGTRHLRHYKTVAIRSYAAWSFLLVLLCASVFVGKFMPQIYLTTHISLIVNNTTQLINTLQFYAAFRLMEAIEFLAKIGTGRVKIGSAGFDEAGSSAHPSDARPSPSQEDMFRIESCGDINV